MTPAAAMARRRPPGWRVDLALTGVAFVWGASFVIVKDALGDISTLLFLGLRFSAAALMLAAVFGRSALRGGRLHESLRGGALAGVCLYGGYTLQTMGLKFTTPSKAGFLTGLYIPLVPVLGALVYRRAPRAAEAGGVLLAAAGMALMTLEGGALRMSGGDLLVAASAVIYAIHILVLGHYTRNGNVAALAIVQIAIAGGLALATCGWAEPVKFVPTRAVWIALGVTSVLATAMAFWVQTWAQQYSGPTRTALIFSLEPVFAWLVSWAATGETLSLRATLGAALILGGILTVEWKRGGGRPAAT